MMFLHLKGVLGVQQIQKVQSLLVNARFIDGRLSAGKEAVAVKKNEELAADNPARRQLDQIVMSALVQNAEYQAFALPLKLATAFYVRYQTGMGYGFHVDDPVMGPLAGRYRSDISTTVFLNAPDEYEGGELVLHTPSGEQAFKGEAGDALVYAAGTGHQVNPVTSGVRLAAVTWAQSMVKSVEQRALLWELARAREGVMAKLPNSEEAARLGTAYANLLRMWSEV